MLNIALSAIPSSYIPIPPFPSTDSNRFEMAWNDMTLPAKHIDMIQEIRALLTTLIVSTINRVESITRETHEDTLAARKDVINEVCDIIRASLIANGISVEADDDIDDIEGNLNKLPPEQRDLLAILIRKTAE